MSFPATAIALTVLLAGGFAAVGEVMLRRRSEGVLGWNESFLVGAGTCAAALFPISLVLGRRALDALMILVGLCLAARVVARVRDRSSRGRRPALPRLAWMDALLVAAIVLTAAAFTILNFRYTFSWDGFQIYASKAKRLFHEGGLTQQWFAEDSYDRRLLEYPPLVAMYEAMLARLRGSFDFDQFKPIFPLFYFSIVVSTFAAVRQRTSLRVALVTGLLVGLLPEIATAQAAGGSSDMPLAAFVAGTVAACLRRESRRAVPFLIGSLTAVKNEGTILAIVASGAILWYWYGSGNRTSGGLRPFRKRVKAHAAGIAVVAAYLVSRLAFLRWLDIHDPTYGPINAANLERAVERLGLVVRVCFRLALDPAVWGVLWPLALIASLVLWARGAKSERTLAGALWSAIGAYTAILLFTNWDVELQAVQAYHRLLSQLAPAALVAIALSYWRMRRTFDVQFPATSATRAVMEGARVGR